MLEAVLDTVDSFWEVGSMIRSGKLMSWDLHFQHLPPSPTGHGLNPPLPTVLKAQEIPCFQKCATSKKIKKQHGQIENHLSPTNHLPFGKET